MSRVAPTPDHPPALRTHSDEKPPEPPLDTAEDRYRRELHRRLENLRGAIRETLVENDALGLKTPARTRTRRRPGRVNRGTRDADRPAPGYRLAHPDDSVAQKHQAFIEWLDDALALALIGRTAEREIRSGRHWTARFVRDSYEKGLTYARARLRDAGIDVSELTLAAAERRPAHETQLETGYVRQHRFVDSIAEGISSESSRLLLDDLAAGAGAAALASKLTGAVRDITTKRADPLATHETARAFDAATAVRYDDASVDMVRVVTFPGACSACELLAAANPYTVREGRSLLPEHPGCRCILLPDTDG